MTGATCSCTMQPCGCCDGVMQLTPVPIQNRPGLDALLYRVGTHAQFFETMQARLSTITVEGVGPDGQTVQTYRPLQGLTTRDRGDLSIALLDGWATVADVLTFYQERIANEGFLRTATERRSVLELARLVGYVLRPGVAATVYLAYTVDENQVEPVTIATGARSQSLPAPGESPQSFETSEDLVARGAWNNLQVRLHRPQNITLDITLSINAAASSVDAVFAALQARGQVLTVATLVVAGTATNLRPGDKLLLTFDDGDATSVVRSVDHIDTQLTDQRTVITLQPVDRTTVACLPLLVDCIIDLQDELDHAGEGDRSFLREVIRVARTIQSDIYLGVSIDPDDWAQQLSQVFERGPTPSVTSLGDRIDALPRPGDSTPHTTDPRTFIQDLLKPAVPQVANSLNLSRSLTTSFAPGADASPQLMVQFAPILRDTFYRAWSGANVNGTVAKLKSVFALRARVTLFGAGAARIPTYFTADTTDRTGKHLAGSLKSPEDWVDWLYAFDENGDNAFLDQANEAITPGSFILTHVTDGDPVRRVLQVAAASVSPRAQYGLSGPSTELEFAPGTEWRQTRTSSPSSTRREITDLRNTQIYAQSDPLTLVDEPITDPVSGTQIELGALYNELKSGRWVILSGERADIANVQGVPVAELLMVSALTQGFDPDRPNDQIHTTLILATPTAYQYKRDTLTIYGNVVKATHGETRNEILGSGDGAQELQSFTLKQPPLTFVAAPTAAGAESTLHVFVDNVEWHEVDSLAGLGPRDHRFVTATDDASTTQVTFGNGIQGARLPTGVQNVNAIYRSGIGVGGNVKARQVSQLQTRPLGVTAVINPLRASGGADKESRDLARDNVPLSVIPLDRLVSLSDYADFTRSFAGIAKAIARRASDGRRQLIHLTIAGADDAPIDRSSDLYRNLLAAFRKLGDRDVPVQVDLRELTALVLSAGVKLLPDFVWEPVAIALRARLLDAFGFGKRALGQPALRCEVLGVMQSVRGVSYVDVDAFGGVTEKTVDNNGNRVLRAPDDIAAAVEGIIHPKARNLRSRAAQASTPGDRVDAFPGGNDHGVIRPAELVIFTPTVPDTLILNQIP
jgi:predicted phage baseplate assembly protein